MRLLTLMLLLSAGCSADTAEPATFWETSEVDPAESSAGGEVIEPDAPAPPVIPDEFAENMVGVWMIDQPNHALYEATWYSFGADGVLEELASETLGHPVPTGTVGHCRAWSPQDDDHCADFTNNGECAAYHPRYCAEWSALSCAFADRWSGNEAELSILASCTDGSSRTVFLDLRELFAGQEDAPVVLSVDGEQDWAHDSFDWRWVKCESDDLSVCGR